MQLEQERQKYVDLKCLYEREKIKVCRITESANYDRTQTAAELSQEKNHSRELRKLLHNLEMQKDSVLGEVLLDKSVLLFKFYLAIFHFRLTQSGTN